MDERARVLLATGIGAAAGALFGYLYLTENGRRFREQLEPRMDDLLSELKRVRGTVEKARQAAGEGWRSINELTNAGSSWERGGGQTH